MEYEKHINRLVLGYLRTKCKSSYKTFLRTNFPSPSKHIGTRVAGQTLEDILRIYSQVQEIVQARLEYTDYYKEHDGSSPMYLAEQLLYLLERRPLATPATTIRDRSPCESSVADDHFSDVETTPEHTLPGNTPINDPNSKTPFRSCSSSEFKTPYSGNIPASNHEYLTSVMSQTLLNNSLLPDKLADNINYVLAQADVPSLSSKELCGNAETKELSAELENAVQRAVSRTERDSIFEGLLEDLWEPLANSFGKALTAEAVAITTSFNSKKHSVSPGKYTNVEEHNNGAISSILAVSNTDHSLNQPTNQVATSSTDTPQVTSTQQNYQVTPPTSQPNNQPQMMQTVQPNIPMPANSQPMCQGPIYAIPPEQQQQQYYIVNRPLVLPPQVQMMQIIQAPTQGKGMPRAKTKNLSERDIMTMPTIILNERNEMAYADPNSVSVNNTPYKSTEVNNIKEYFNVFGATVQSPIIKSVSTLKPTPTVKVEIYNRDTPLPTNANTCSKGLPNLANTTTDDDVIIVATDPSSTEKGLKSTPNEIRVEPVKPEGLRSARTPSPLVAVAKKPTPKSSSHVRNLTFPSPLKRTSEKNDEGQSLPLAISKQQATKDLFKNMLEEVEEPKANTPKSIKSTPKRNKSAPKRIKTTPKKPIRTKKPVTKKETDSKVHGNKSPLSWDATLRKNLASNAEEINESTPLRRASARKRVTRSTEIDTTEADGKLIEDALKTPAGKSKGKSPRKKPRAETENKPDKEKVPQVEEVPKVEISVEPKTILSPSNLGNATSKRNMEFDGITPNNSREGSNQLVSNARKDISSMLETPSKDAEIETDSPPDQLTPLLQANLKGFTTDGHFSIHTPSFPITPGLAFNMDTSSAPYYTLNDTETNKATEAIVLLEERKSSVRKTDDEDVALSPNVHKNGYLNDFNKFCIAKKNLDLINHENVQWDGSSDKEYQSEESLNDETNNTVIPNIRRTRTSGKSMSILKSNFLDKSGQEVNESEILEENTEDKLETEVQAKGVSTSSDSEIISKAEFTNKKKLDDIDEEKTNNVNKCEQSCSNVSISTITAETIKEAVSTTTLTSHMTTAYSIKKEMDEKRNRMINLEKAGKKPQARRQRNAKPNSNAATNKRKKHVSKKVKKDSDDSEENDNNKTDSQDEFFKKSGTNLHRTRNQMERLGKSEKNSDKSKHTPESETKEDESASKEDKSASKEDKSASKEDKSASKEDKSVSKEDESAASKEVPEVVSTSNLEDPELDESIYGYRVMQTLSKEIHIKYDPEKSSKKRFEDYKTDLSKIGLKLLIPLHDGSEQVVHTTASKFRFVLDIEPSECGSDLENVEESRIKKRKHRTSSTNSNTSCKKLKTSLIPNLLAIPSSLGGKDVREKVLAQLHGPSDKI